MEISDLIIFVVGAALGLGPAAAKLVQLKRLVQGAARYLDSLPDENSQICQDAIGKGTSEVVDILCKYLPKTKEK